MSGNFGRLTLSRPAASNRIYRSFRARKSYNAISNVPPTGIECARKRPGLTGFAERKRFSGPLKGIGCEPQRWETTRRNQSASLNRGEPREPGSHSTGVPLRVPTPRERAADASILRSAPVALVLDARVVRRSRLSPLSGTRGQTKYLFGRPCTRRCRLHESGQHTSAGPSVNGGETYRSPEIRKHFVLFRPA